MYKISNKAMLLYLQALIYLNIVQLFQLKCIIIIIKDKIIMLAYVLKYISFQTYFNIFKNRPRRPEPLKTCHLQTTNKIKKFALKFILS